MSLIDATNTVQEILKSPSFHMRNTSNHFDLHENPPLQIKIKIKV